MKTLKEAFNTKYPNCEYILRVFEDALGHEPTWDSITKENLDLFTRAMKERVSINSARTYLAKFKAVLRLYSDQVTLPIGFECILTPKKSECVSAWLTDEEIERLIAYKPASECESTIRDQFILGCLTGARHSDYIWFDKSNICNGKLVYVSKKTHIKSEIPLAPAVERILTNSKFTKKYSDTAFTNNIRAICMKCGINEIVKIFHGGQELVGEKWKYVSSHTARRSFATNLYLRCHDIFMVSKYMGHTSVDMTAKYILSIGDAPREVKEYFEKFR